MRGRRRTPIIATGGTQWALVGDLSLAERAARMALDLGTVTATIAAEDLYGRAHRVERCEKCGVLGVAVAFPSEDAPGLGTHDMPELAPDVWQSSPFFCRAHLPSPPRGQR